ncbi:MAG: hypothetical protein RIR70_1324 [Pseudomonadota bacterium]|jgi:hypothetical protein
MRAEKFPVEASARWIAQGFALFRKGPGFLNFLWFATWLGVVMISLFPLIGQAVGSLVMPGLLAGILNGCKALERGDKPNPAVILSAFESSKRAMVGIGVVYLLVSSLIFAVSLILAGDALEPLLGGKGSATQIDPALASQLLVQLLVTLYVALLISSPTLVAAPLAAWHGLPMGKALFFALMGMVRNLSPLLALYAAWILISFGLPWLVLSIAPGVVKNLLQLVLSFALAFVVLPTTLASFYCAISDIFHTGPSEPHDE